MRNSWNAHFILFLLFMMLLTSQCKSSEDKAISVCEGNNVKLFTNTKLNQEELRLTLYHNDSAIDVWTRNISNNTFKHDKQIKRDENYDIWLYNSSTNDQGLYFVLYSRRLNGSRREELNGTLLILVPPSPGCKPVINVTQNGEIYYLNASIPETGCDTPHGTLTWTDSSQNTSMLRVNSTEKPGLYIACIRGPAMDCVKDRRVYCSEIYVNKSDSFGNETDHADYKINTGVIVLIILLPLLVTTSFVAAFFGYKRSRSRSQSRNEQYTRCAQHNGTHNGEITSSC